MSIVISNSYADKVFAEQPVVLWALDENVTHVSFVPENERTISTGNGWTVTNGTPSVYSGSSPEAQLESVVNKILVGTVSIGDSTTVLSPAFANYSDFNVDLESFVVSTYLYAGDQQATVDIGYSYLDEESVQQLVYKTVTIDEIQKWAFISESFDIPDSFSNLQAYLKLTYPAAGSVYSFFINGLDVSQWSEQFNVSSLGVNTIELPDNITPIGTGATTKPYGLQDTLGYYLSNKGLMCASNAGLPLVYGASNSTRITPNIDEITGENYPSLVLPGFGFMNDSGQYSDATLEFWVKIQSSATVPRRIVGPVSSSDGLYVNDSFLVLKVGTNTSSYYIGEWDRPMLISIKLSSTSASLMLNGEEVISMTFIASTIDYPPKYDTSEETTKDQDWLAFYAYEDVPLIELDCVGIYPYLVPAIVQKRRWIYGQGLDAFENIGNFNLGTAVAIDYPMANYSKNYFYPDIGKWQQGISENLKIDNTSINLPDYSLPQITFNNKTINDFYKDLSAIQPEDEDSFITLRPNSLWDNTNGYIEFSSINSLIQDTKCFYGLFESNTEDSSKQTLFYVENTLNFDYFEITIEGSDIVYTLQTFDSTGSPNTPIIKIYDNASPSQTYTPGDIFLAGLNIDNFCKANGTEALSFFGLRQKLKVYVGGKGSLSNTFSGKIYRVGFCTARNLEKIESLFNITGELTGMAIIADSYDPVETTEHIASYTLVPKKFIDTFTLDVATNGYWQDYVPLAYFGKYVTSKLNEKVFDLDFIQFNISYPELNIFTFNGYDTTDSIIKTHVSFQRLTENANTSVKQFTDENTFLPPISGVIEPGENWEFEKYGITNDMIIYPPRDIDFKDLALVVHLEVLAAGIVENPIKIQSLQLSSQALNSFIPTAIGTKYGTDIYPYTRSTDFTDYKHRNPYTIYKGSSPYFYLTGSSGVRLRDTVGQGEEHGIRVPINQNASSFYRLSGLQMALRYKDNLFPEEITEVFQIENSELNTRFYMVPDTANRKRARVYAVDSNTGLLDSNIVFYVNGKIVKTPVINIDSWTILGLVFGTPLIFDNYTGALNLTGEISVDNILQYQSSLLESNARSTYRKWFAVNSVDGNQAHWGYWKTGTDPSNTPPILATTPYSWKTVLFSNERSLPTVDGESVYKKYTGTDRIVADTDSVFRLNKYQYTFFDNVTWQENIVTPA